MPWLCAVITCNLASWNQRQCCSGALRGSRAGCLHTKPTTTRFSTTSILQNISQPSSAGDAHILVLSTQAVYKQRSKSTSKGLSKCTRSKIRKVQCIPAARATGACTSACRTTAAPRCLRCKQSCGMCSRPARRHRRRAAAPCASPPRSVPPRSPGPSLRIARVRVRESTTLNRTEPASTQGQLVQLSLGVCPS